MNLTAQQKRIAANRIPYAPGYQFRTPIRGREELVTVLHYHGCGTCDVQSADGSRHRVSGLPLLRVPK